MLGAARPRPPAPPGLYAWLDALPLSRRKRHLARDFSDGVMLAEVVKLFRPRLVDLHNYVPTCNTGQKRSNWNVLNRKVFHKLGLSVSEEEIRKVIGNTPGAIEPILCAVRDKVEAGEDPPGMAAHKCSGPGRTPSSGGPVPLPVCDRETPAGLRTRMESAPPGDLTAQRRSPLQEAGHSCGDAGLLSPSVRSGPETCWSQRAPETCWSQRAPEKRDHCPRRGCPAGEPWHHLDPGLPQRLLEEKEQALAVLQETIKILQMKVARLEYLVKLKDQRIGALMRQGDQPPGGGTPRPEGPPSLSTRLRPRAHSELP